MRSINLATQRITYGERAHLVSKDSGALVATSRFWPQELYYGLQKCTPVAADDNPEITDLVNSSAPRLPRFSSEEDIAGSELQWKFHTGKTEAGLIMLE
ncbi:hypothetical protein GQ457_18G014640 [Hibiscus cannabinus]